MSLVQQINMNMNLDSAGDNYLGLHCSRPCRSQIIHTLRVKLCAGECLVIHEEHKRRQLRRPSRDAGVTSCIFSLLFREGLMQCNVFVYVYVFD